MAKTSEQKTILISPAAGARRSAAQARFAGFPPIGGPEDRLRA